jgi:glycosyltransferase involved in cell wall biosynthesis
MRVLIATIGHFHDLPSGSSKIALDEAIALQRRGDEVWVLAPGSHTLPEHELRDGVHLLRYAAAPKASWNPARSSSHQDAATAVLTHHLPRVDAVHGHVPLQYLAALNTYGDSVHACYTIHSPASMEMAVKQRKENRLQRIRGRLAQMMIHRLEAECLRRSHVVTALSQYTIGCIAQLHGRSIARKVQLVSGWVDTSKFVPIEDRECAKLRLGWPTGAPVLFTLRRLTPRMGLDRLLVACQILHFDGFRFHLIIGGDGPLRPTLQEQARTLGLGDIVTFQGHIDDERLPVAYAACDAFILPTAELECFGIIALEALSAGRPVLATPVGAIPEIIDEFSPQWLARSAHPTDIADLLRRYLEGRLPTLVPTQLHDQVHRTYSRERVLDTFIETTVGKDSNALAL